MSIGLPAFESSACDSCQTIQHQLTRVKQTPLFILTKSPISTKSFLADKLYLLHNNTKAKQLTTDTRAKTQNTNKKCNTPTRTRNIEVIDFGI